MCEIVGDQRGLKSRRGWELPKWSICNNLLDDRLDGVLAEINVSFS
jgi:hypothetical protein